MFFDFLNSADAELVPLCKPLSAETQAEHSDCTPPATQMAISSEEVFIVDTADTERNLMECASTSVSTLYCTIQEESESLLVFIYDFRIISTELNYRRNRGSLLRALISG